VSLPSKIKIKGEIITLFQREGIWYCDFRRVGGLFGWWIKMGE